MDFMIAFCVGMTISALLILLFGREPPRRPDTGERDREVN